MPKIASLNKSIIQEAGACMRLGYLRARDRDGAEGAGRSAAEELRLMYGRKVGERARGQFPGGILIEADDFAETVARTRAALDSGERILFEAAFSFRGVNMKADVLVRGDDGWHELYEVKSGLDPSAYLEDVAIQVWVLRGLGMRVRARLMVPDPTATIDSDSPFAVVDCEAEALLPEVERRIGEIRSSVAAGRLPAVPFTRACRDCEFLRDCLPALPRHSVFTLRRGGAKIDKLLRRGVRSLDAIPSRFKLSAPQEIQVASARSGTPWASRGLSRRLGQGVKFPLYFLDFEAAAPPLPEFAAQRPYDLLPFQWSCHVQPSPGAELEHGDFLMAEPGDPREPFAISLVRRLGRSGSIVVYGQYESTVIKSLARALPRLRWALKSLLPRIFDLHGFINKNYYHPEFRGSLSIKKVLPVLVPGLSYEGMEIGDGMEAVLAYHRLTEGALSEPKRKALSESLRAYCKLDTLAMAKLFEFLSASA